MQRYDSYKDSGIQWLGEIPSHWGIYKIRYNYYLKGRIGWQGLKSNEFCDVGPYLVTGTDFERGRIIWERCYHISQKRYDEAPEIHVMEGDLLMTKDGTVGKTAYVDSKPPQVSLNSHLLIVRPLYKGKCDNKFLQYVIYSNIFVDFYKIYSSGSIMESISQEKFCDFRFPLPHIKEQQAIVSYLDTATAKIDEAIAQQQKMIDLLNERKQIIINNAVTKGLNPNAKMKPSGIDWIGNIPEHWEVKRIRYIGEANNGLTYSPNDMVDEGSGILVLRSSNIQGGKLVFDDNVFVKNAPSKLLVRKGDIIICSRNGSASLVGKCAIVENNIYASYGAFMMRFRSGHNNKYIYYLLTSAIGHYKQLFSTSTINQLTLGIFADIKMPFVSNPTEQADIANSLDVAISEIDTTIYNASKKIDLLHERKQIIINDVVTGKVKVV